MSKQLHNKLQAIKIVLHIISGTLVQDADLYSEIFISLLTIKEMVLSASPRRFYCIH